MVLQLLISDVVMVSVIMRVEQQDCSGGKNVVLQILNEKLFPVVFCGKGRGCLIGVYILLIEGRFQHVKSKVSNEKYCMSLNTFGGKEEEMKKNQYQKRQVLNRAECGFRFLFKTGSCFSSLYLKRKLDTAHTQIYIYMYFNSLFLVFVI